MTDEQYVQAAEPETLCPQRTNWKSKPWRKGQIRITRECLSKLLGLPEGTVLGEIRCNNWPMPCDDDTFIIKVYHHESLPEVPEGTNIPDVYLSEPGGPFVQ